MVDRKIELVDKLNHIMTANGFNTLSMNELAKRANVSRAKLYIYFKNKQEIVTAVVDRHLKFINQQLHEDFKSTVTDYVRIKLNQLLLIGAQSPIFRTELKQYFPELSIRLEQAYHTFKSSFLSVMVKLQNENVIIQQIDFENLFVQDELMIHAALSHAIDNKFNLEKAQKLLGNYLEIEIRGTVNDQSLVANAFLSNQELLKIIWQELNDTYFSVISY